MARPKKNLDAGEGMVEDLDQSDLPETPPETVTDETFEIKAKLIREAFGAEYCSVSPADPETGKSTFILSDADEKEIIRGTLEELAFVALASPARSAAPANSQEIEELALPDPILTKAYRKHPINGLDDLKTVLNDIGADLQVEKEGDFYNLTVTRDQGSRGKLSVYSESVSVNATKEQLTKFFRKAEAIISPQASN